MTQCLVTKLKGAVSDSSLTRLGELRIGVSRVDSPTRQTQSFTFSFFKSAQLEIIGEGYFTDVNLTANNGKTQTIQANTPTTVYVSNGDFEVAVLDKYSLRSLSFSGIEDYAQSAQMNNRSLNIDDLRYSTSVISLTLSSSQVTGDLSSLSGLTALTSLALSNSQVTGNLSSLSGLTALTSLALSNSQVTGNLSSLSGLTEMMHLTLTNSQVTGDLSSLSGMTKMIDFEFTGITVTGNLSSLSAMSGLVNLTANGIEGDLNSLYGMSKLKIFVSNNSNITGDLARMPATFYLGQLSANAQTFTWSSRTSPSKIIGIYYGVSVDNVDKLLQDEAGCEAQSDAVPFQRVINLSGTRTSASDGAVETLQEKGYTVSVAKSE